MIGSEEIAAAWATIRLLVRATEALSAATADSREFGRFGRRLEAFTLELIADVRKAEQKLARLRLSAGRAEEDMALANRVIR